MTKMPILMKHYRYYVVNNLTNGISIYKKTTYTNLAPATPSISMEVRLI